MTFEAKKKVISCYVISNLRYGSECSTVSLQGIGEGLEVTQILTNPKNTTDRTFEKQGNREKNRKS